MAEQINKPLTSNAKAELGIVPALPAFTRAVGRWVTKWYSIDGPGYMIRASRCQNAYFVAARVSGGLSPNGSEAVIRTPSGRKYLWGIWAMSCGTGFEPNSEVPTIEPDDVVGINSVASYFSICSDVAGDLESPEPEDPEQEIKTSYPFSPNDPDVIHLQSFVDNLPDNDTPDRMGMHRGTAITGIVYALSAYLRHISQYIKSHYSLDSTGYMLWANQCKNAFFVAARVLTDPEFDTNASTDSAWGIWVVGCGDGSPKSLTALSINDIAGRVSNCPFGKEIKASLTLSDTDVARLLAFLAGLPTDSAPDKDSLPKILPASLSYLNRISTPLFYTTTDSGYMLRASACRNVYFVAARILLSDNDRDNGMRRQWDAHYGTDFLRRFENYATHFGAENIWGIWGVGSGNGFLSPFTPPTIEITAGCRAINPVARSFANYVAHPDPSPHSRFLSQSASDVVHLQSFVDNLS